MISLTLPLVIKILLVTAGVVLLFQGGSLLVLSYFVDAYKRSRVLYVVTLGLGAVLIVLAIVLIPG